ncbi:MAG: hypothetical protein WDN28_18885 [Chthoniobacter sp.]
MSDQPAPAEPTPEQRFRDALKKIVDVPKDEILRREEEYRRQRAKAKKQRAA